MDALGDYHFWSFVQIRLTEPKDAAHHYQSYKEAALPAAGNKTLPIYFEHGMQQFLP